MATSPDPPANRNGPRGGRFRSRPVSRILSWSNHLSGPRCRRSAAYLDLGGQPRRSCLALHRVGFAAAAVSPRRRCALTAPFHPYRPRRSRATAQLRRCRFCGTFPRVSPGRRYRPPCPAVSGLSSKAYLLELPATSAVARSATFNSSRGWPSGELGGGRKADHQAHRGAARERQSHVVLGDAARQRRTAQHGADPGAEQSRVESSEETRPCLACGTAFSAAREAGTNSIPRPRPNGTSNGRAPAPSSGTPGIARTPRPSATSRNPSATVMPSPRDVGQPPRERRADDATQCDQRERRRRPQRRIARRGLEVLLADVERADHHSERERGDQRGRSHHALAQAGRVGTLVRVHLAWHQPHQGERRGGARGNEEPPARAPVDRDGQEPAHDGADQVRDAGARAPDAERGPAALGREPGHRARQRGRADEARADALHDAGGDQHTDAPRERADEGARREHASPASPTGAIRAGPPEHRRETAPGRRRRSTPSGRRRAGASPRRARRRPKGAPP